MVNGSAGSLEDSRQVLNTPVLDLKLAYISAITERVANGVSLDIARDYIPGDWILG